MCVCVFVWDNGNPLMLESDLIQALFPFCQRNFDEDPEEKTLIACTYCVNNGIVLETSLPSHLLLFQPHMQAVFHLSLPSPSVACNCWDHLPPPPPPGGSGAICTSRLDGAERSLSLTHTGRELMSVVFIKQSCNMHMIWFIGTYEWKATVACSMAPTVKWKSCRPQHFKPIYVWSLMWL